MKNLMKKLVFVCFLAILATTVSALNVNDATLSGDLGDAQATFKIKNNHNYPLMNITISDSAPNKYNITFEDIPSSLQVNEEATVKIKGGIPDDLDAGIKTKIGQITVNAIMNVPDNSSPQSFGSFGKFKYFADIDHEDVIDDFATQDFPEYENDTLPDDATCDFLNQSLFDLNTDYDQRSESMSNFQFLSWVMSYYNSKKSELEQVWFELECGPLPNFGDSDNNNDNNDNDNDDSDDNDDNNNDDNDNDNDDNNDNEDEDDNSVSGSADIFMKREKKLVIDRVKINCDGLETVEEGDTISDVLPDSTCELTIRVENLYNDNDDIEFDEVEVEVDGDSDIDGEKKTIALDPEERQTVTLDIEIDNNADGKQDVVITVEGEDSNDVMHRDTLAFELDIEKPSHSLSIESVNVVPGELTVCDDQLDIAVRIKNDGSFDEEDLAVEFKIVGISFTKKLSDLYINEGDEKTVTITVPKSKFKAGSHIVGVTAFYENIVQSDFRTATFKINPCEEQESAPEVKVEKKEQQVIVVPPKKDEIVEALPAEEPGWNIYTSLLLMGNVVALGLLGLLGVSIARSWKKD